MGTPGEVAAQLAGRQIMVCGEITGKVHACPACVILIVRHEASLPEKVGGSGLHGIAAVFVQVLHLPEAFRQRLRLPHRSRRKGQRCIPVDPDFRLGRLLQHHGEALFIAGDHSPVEQPENQFRVRFVCEGHADPFRPLHPDRRRQPGQAAFGQRLHPALQVAALDLLAGLRIPLPHKQRHPLPGPWMRENGKAGKAVPLVLFLDLIDFSRIGSQLRQFHPLTSSGRNAYGRPACLGIIIVPCLF